MPRRGGWPNPLDLDPAAARTLIDAARGYTLADGTSAVVAFEGPNEYDISHGPDPDWTGTLSAYQKMMYGLVKADPEFGDRPVLAPSFARRPPASLDLRSAFDALDVHSYPGGKPAGQPLAYNLDLYRRWAPGPFPVVSTETGYHNALGNGTAQGAYISQPGVPESVEAKYLPRLSMESFHQGVARTFTYELLDVFANSAGDHQEKHFGLLRNDVTPKPAFTALQNTLALLSDPGPAFEPAALGAVIEGAPADVRTVVLQKRDGRHYVVLWREVSSYEIASGWRSGQAGTVLGVPTAPVTLRLAAAARGATVYRPTAGADPVATLGPGRAFALDVPDELLVVEVTPNRAPTATPDEAETTGDTGVLIDVLGNDTDPDGDPLRAVIAASAAHGAAVVDGSGAIAYTPAAGFSGADVFRYAVTDGAATSAPVAVRVTVRAGAPAARVVLDGPEGWRFIGAPTEGMTVGQLLGPIWTQGSPGADDPSGPSNVYLYDAAAGAYAAATSADQPAVPGRGLAVYVYAEDRPGVPGRFPKALPIVGPAPAAPFAFPVGGAALGDPVAQGWHLLANPFPTPLWWDAPGWSRVAVGPAIYVWDAAHPGGPQYRV